MLLYSRFELGIRRLVFEQPTVEGSLEAVLQLVDRIREEIEVSLLTPPDKPEEQLYWYLDLCLQLLAELRTRSEQGSFAAHLVRLRAKNK